MELPKSSTFKNANPYPSALLPSPSTRMSRSICSEVQPAGTSSLKAIELFWPPTVSCVSRNAFPLHPSTTNGAGSAPSTLVRTGIAGTSPTAGKSPVKSWTVFAANSCVPHSITQTAGKKRTLMELGLSKEGGLGRGSATNESDRSRKPVGLPASVSTESDSNSRAGLKESCQQILAMIMYWSD